VFGVGSAGDVGILDTFLLDFCGYFSDLPTQPTLPMAHAWWGYQNYYCYVDWISSQHYWPIFALLQWTEVWCTQW